MTIIIDTENSFHIVVATRPACQSIEIDWLVMCKLLLSRA